MYVCSCRYVHEGVRVNMNVGVYYGGQELWGVPKSLGHPPSYFLRQCLLLHMESIDSPTRPMSFRPLVLNLQMPDFTWVLEIRSSRLHGRHLQTESSSQFCPYKNPFPTKIIYDPASVSSKTTLLPRPCKTPVQPEPHKVVDLTVQTRMILLLLCRFLPDRNIAPCRQAL